MKIIKHNKKYTIAYGMAHEFGYLGFPDYFIKIGSKAWKCMFSRSDNEAIKAVDFYLRPKRYYS